MLGLLYLPAAFLAYISLSEFSGYLHILLLLLIWSSDVLAYFTGKIVGGPKLLARISPNKTWAGFVGAILGPAILMALSYTVFFPDIDCTLVDSCEGTADNPHSYWKLCVLAGFIGLVGQIGDLLVSFMKRKAGVKDTGTIFPGHGGVLDRIDSMLLASLFFAFAYMTGLTLKL